MAAPRRRKALPITEAELRLIASAAIIDLLPRNGHSETRESGWVVYMGQF